MHLAQILALAFVTVHLGGSVVEGSVSERRAALLAQQKLDNERAAERASESAALAKAEAEREERLSQFSYYGGPSPKPKNRGLPQKLRYGGRLAVYRGQQFPSPHDMARFKAIFATIKEECDESEFEGDIKERYDAVSFVYEAFVGRLSNPQESGAADVAHKLGMVASAAILNNMDLMRKPTIGPAHEVICEFFCSLPSNVLCPGIISTCNCVPVEQR